jgi:hypothetical protein
MTKNQMPAAQLGIRGELVELLRGAGWDFGGWEALFQAGSNDLSPELQAEFNSGRAKLTFGWGAEKNEISLRIEDPATPPHAFRIPSRGREVALAKSLIANQGDITTASFGGAIRALADIAGLVYWESSGGTVELKPTRGGSTK